MEIIQNTPTQLILNDQNRQWFWGTLFGLPFVVFGLAVAVTTGKVTTLECQRLQTGILCQRIITGLAGANTTELPGQLLKANVITEHGTGVVLGTSAGRVDLANHRVQVDARHYRTAHTINAFINNPQQSALTVQQDDRWQAWAFGMAFFLPGLAIIGVSLAIPMTVVCQFDRSTGQLMVEKCYRWFGAPALRQEPLAQVKRAVVMQHSISSHTPIYGVQLELLSSEVLDLVPPTRDRQQCQTIADAINQFLTNWSLD